VTPRGILHLSTYLQGGAGRAIVDLACAQRRLGHRVTVVASETSVGEYGNYAEYLEQLRRSGVVLLLRDSLFSRDSALNLEVLDLLRQRVDVAGVDVVHAHAAIPARVGRLFAADSPRRVPVVQTQHGWGTNKTTEQSATDLAILRDVDRVITTSSATRELLAGLGVPPSSMTVIPCGLDRDDVGPPPREAERLLQPLRDRGAFVAGCIGSVTANKNQHLLVEALAMLSNLDVVAVFVGEGGEALVEAAARANVAGRVIACGYQPQASRWLPLMDLLVLPSQSEGQGLAVLEAFRAGVPALVSRIPALAELVQDGCGLAFDPGSARALAGAIRTAATLSPPDRTTLTDAARSRFLKDFTSDLMVARHEELYTALR
jgi:glycosyltransferase involved in cell wall biosynthesis